MTRMDFTLISKKTGINFAKYKRKVLFLSEQVPSFVDEIIIGQSGKKRHSRVMTFRDANKTIIERIYDYPSKPLKNVLYTHNDYVIGEEEFVKSTTRKEYYISRSTIKLYKEFQDILSDLRNKTFFWSHHKTETNHLSENIYTGEKILSRTSIVNINGIDKEIHRFVEFPHIIGRKIKKNVCKFLYFEVDKTTGNVIKDSIFSDGIKYSKNDKFLQFRALDLTDMKEPITRKFMLDRKVDKLCVAIDTKYLPIDEKEKKKLVACFIPSIGAVSFNMLYKLKSKSFLVDVARHEVEHIWHYFLDARNRNHPSDTWQSDIYKKFGAIKNKILKLEADKCTDAIKNYVVFKEDYQAYSKNYIEVEAKLVGTLAREKYDKLGAKLRNSLPHIPKELL